MRPGEFWEALHAFREEAETNRMHIGELIRGHCIRVINLFAKRPVRTVTEFWPMPWDEKKQTAEDMAAELNSMSDEERNALARQLMDKLDGNSSKP